MRIAVTSTGGNLDAPFSPLFGRCPTFVVVDTDAMSFQAFPNGGRSASGGAGIQAAQDAARLGVQAVVTGSVGPNAYQVLAAAGLPVYSFDGGTVRDAVEAFKAGGLIEANDATGPAHGGMGGGPGSGGRGRHGGRAG